VTAKTGHHKVTADGIALAIGLAGTRMRTISRACRRKRNVIDYTRSHVATDTEADEIVTNR
jgi:hypothetical protein